MRSNGFLGIDQTIQEVGIPSPGQGFPYLSNKKAITSQKWITSEEKKPAEIRLHRCGCGSTWCDKCFKHKGQREITKRLQGFNWRKTRRIVLTVDRDQFKDGEEAHGYITKKRLIANMVWNLRRTVGIEVLDLLWNLEWHEDGFPHYHVFVEVDKVGKEGMITGKILRKYWTVGQYVFEGYIESERHWRNIVGYFRTHGYFEKDKGYQTRLPGWALKRNRKIRRWGGMILEGCSDLKKEKKREGEILIKNYIEAASTIVKEPRSYSVILQGCGKKTFVEVSTNLFHRGKQINVEYAVLRFALERFKGRYIPGIGYKADLNLQELKRFIDGFEELNVFWWLLLEDSPSEAVEMAEERWQGCIEDSLE